MKSSFLKIGLRFFVFQLGLFLCQSIWAVPGFTVTPSAISNTYSGPITLQVTGLISGDTVVVQKFLDANTNDVVDAPDFMVQQFNLTDGSAGMAIGGVTNINVPGDTDGSANGSIAVKFNFPDHNFMQNTIGQFIFRLSSPSGHFATTNILFNITNFPFAQKITGTVVSNTTPVPNAVIILFPGASSGDHQGPGNPVGGTVANNSGVYSIQVPPGTYVPVAFKSNYVANFSTSPLLTLSSGTITTNLALTGATASISGKLVDANISSIGLPGVLVPATSDSGSLAVGFTDTNGNFTLRVGSGSWGIDGNAAGSLNSLGYVSYDGNTNVNANTSNLILPFQKATALFYGAVKDNLGNPLPGIDINADGGGTYSSDSVADTNGYYVVGVLDIGMSWQVQVSNDGRPANYLFSQGAYDPISSGQAVQVNFTAVLATNHISGHVQFNGTNVVGVQVDAYATIGTNNYQAQMDTDANGNYSLNVANGNWDVNVFQCCDDDSLDNILGGGNYQPPSDQNITISNNNKTADFTIQPCGGVQIITTSLPDGTNGVYYYAQLQASSCNSSFTWTGPFGGSLPGGLTLNSDGTINGTPDTTGTYNFSVQVQDGNGHTTDTNLSLYIAPASSALQINTTSLPNGNVGATYSTQLNASGGQPPYNWSLATGSQPLPPGLNILNYSPAPGSSIGSIAGTPTTNGLFPFIVQVTDANSKSVTQPLGLIINPKPSLGSAAKSSGTHFQFLLNAASNQNYTIQVSTNLSSTNWTTLVVTNNTTANSFLIMDPNATNKQRFYRAVIGP